jgi:hypothetical protein
MAHREHQTAEAPSAGTVSACWPNLQKASHQSVAVYDQRNVPAGALVALRMTSLGAHPALHRLLWCSDSAQTRIQYLNQLLQQRCIGLARPLQPCSLVVVLEASWCVQPSQQQEAAAHDSN